MASGNNTPSIYVDIDIIIGKETTPLTIKFRQAIRYRDAGISSLTIHRVFKYEIYIMTEVMWAVIYIRIEDQPVGIQVADATNKFTTIIISDVSE